MDVTTTVLLVVGLVVALLAGAAAGGYAATVLGRSAAAARSSTLRAERDTLAAERDRLRAETARADESRREAEHRAAGLQATLDAERRAAGERAELVESTMAERFRALSSAALEQNNRQFLQLADQRMKEAQTRAAGDLDRRREAVETLVMPLRETLGKVETQLRELESARLTAYTSLTEQVGLVRQTGEQLRRETASLGNALRSPQVRGRWGELQLERIVELAGMTEHCDVVRQSTVETDDGRQRPDLVVRLAGGKTVVVDSKVPLTAYLEAVEATDEAARADRLRAHARQLRRHVEQLAAKEYWAAFSAAPEFVVLFVPGEAFLAPALEHDPSLLEQAMAKRVVIATPTTLIAMLRTVAYAWQQAALTDNARAVFEVGRQLYDRLGKLGDKVDALGRAISRVVTSYNTAVGSLETRVLVSARRMRDLGVVDAELPGPAPVEQTARPLGSGELVASATEARQIRLLYEEAEDADEAGDSDEDAAGDGSDEGTNGRDDRETYADERYGVRPAPGPGPGHDRAAGR